MSISKSEARDLLKMYDAYVPGLLMVESLYQESGDREAVKRTREMMLVWEEIRTDALEVVNPHLRLAN